jgi:hypothetical protein
MKRQEMIERLAQLARESAAQTRRREEELARVQGPPRPGDLVVIPTTAPVIHWLLVKAHPEDSRLLFAVPADDNPEVGPDDVRAPEGHLWGPATFRCSFGLWIEADLLGPPWRVGQFGEEVLGSVRAVLGRLAAGKLQATEEQAALDADPDHLAWLDEVEKSRTAAGEWLAAAGKVFLWEEMDPDPPEVLRSFADRIAPDKASRLRYAAEGGGVRNRVSRRLADAYRASWLPTDEPGLYLVANAEGVRAVWVGPGKPSPLLRPGMTEDTEDTVGLMRPAPRSRGPTSLRAGKEDTGGVRWTDEKDFQVSEVWPWTDGRVVLRIGPGEGRKVVIRQ